MAGIMLVAPRSRGGSPADVHPGHVLCTRCTPLGEVLDTGADDFMAKPPDRGELWGRLRAAERVLALQAALIRQADTDQMTELLNRTAFLRQADEVFASQDEQVVREPVSLLLLDIDRFKAINDGHGHAVAMPSYVLLPMPARDRRRCRRLGARSLDFFFEVTAAGAPVSSRIKFVPVAQGCQCGCRRRSSFHGEHRRCRAFGRERVEALLRRADEAPVFR